MSEAGLWQSSVCVNCQTSILHTENDCTYTVITTPNQGTNVVPIFLFEIQKGTNGSWFNLYVFWEVFVSSPDGVGSERYK